MFLSNAFTGIFWNFTFLFLAFLKMGNSDSFHLLLTVRHQLLVFFLSQKLYLRVPFDFWVVFFWFFASQHGA